MDIKFVWTDRMSVHNDVIDTQHKELFTKLNELLGAIVDDNAEDIVEDMVYFFEKYMNRHLAYEEQFLKEIGYPEVKQHHNQHIIFIDKYNELRDKLSEDSVDKSMMVFEIENFMGS